MNAIFSWMILGSLMTVAWTAWQSGDLANVEAFSKAIVDSAGGAVQLALGLVGVMSLFLGLMKIAEEGGLLKILARLIRPLMIRLFPEVPADHPAMGAMIMNFSTNILGLGNAATPFGIKAMQALDQLNPSPGTATNAMALFLAINTSSITLLPTGVIALRAAAGSADPAAILPTTLFATCCSTLVAITSALLYQKWVPVPSTSPIITKQETATVDIPSPDTLQKNMIKPTEPGADLLFDSTLQQGYPLWISLLVLVAILSIIPLFIFYGSQLSPWVLPALFLGFILFGMARRVPIYETMVEGAKEGFQVAIRIIPYLVMILTAIGMLRESGVLPLMVTWLGQWTTPLGLPPEALPMVLIRPLSGSGAYGVLAAILNDPAIGPDSYIGYLVSTIQGSTETTFYVLAVYFGAVQVKRVRHTLAAALTAELAGVVASVIACKLLI